jgi:hypothetical protein
MTYTFTPIMQDKWGDGALLKMEAEGWKLISVSVTQTPGLPNCFYCFWRKDSTPHVKTLETLYPFPCALCGKDVMSIEDRDWHGLGNCVGICPSCVGSGSDEKRQDTIEKLSDTLAKKMPPKIWQEAGDLAEWLRAEMKQFFDKD